MNLCSSPRRSTRLRRAGDHIFEVWSLSSPLPVLRDSLFLNWMSVLTVAAFGEEQFCQKIIYPLQHSIILCKCNSVNRRQLLLENERDIDM